jgi:hypothetical protein
VNLSFRLVPRPLTAAIIAIRPGDRAARRRRINGNGAAGSIPAVIRATIDTAPRRPLKRRAAFEAAWRDYLPKRCEADFEAWRQDAAWHAAKYARWDRKGERRI